MRMVFAVLAASFILVLAAGAAMADLSSGLTARYTFEGNTDDVSGSGYNGLASGIGYEEGRDGGQAGVFYGASYVDLGTGLAPKHWTVAAWVKVASIGGRQVIFAANDETSGEDGILLVIPKSTKGKARARAMASGTWFHAQDGMALVPGKWTFLAGTSDGAKVTLYRDGVAVSQKAVTNPPTTDDPTMPTVIGARGAMNGSFFHGAIDDLLVYSRALSAEEIALLHTDGVEGGDGGDEEPELPTGGSADIPSWYYYWASSSSFRLTQFFITNRGDKAVDVTVSLFDYNNQPVTAPIIRFEGQSYPGDNAQFTLQAGCSKLVALQDYTWTSSVYGRGTISWAIAEGEEGGLNKPLGVVVERHPSSSRMGMYQLMVNGDVWF